MDTRGTWLLLGLSTRQVGWSYLLSKVAISSTEKQASQVHTVCPYISAIRVYSYYVLLVHP